MTMVIHTDDEQGDVQKQEVHLLLTDGEGWAALYNNRAEARSDLSMMLMHDDLIGEQSYKNAYLVLASGVVVPANTTNHRPPFDDAGYSQYTLKFSSAVPEGGAEYVVSWRVDGRV